MTIVQRCRQTTGFNELSIEAGILLGGNGEQWCMFNGRQFTGWYHDATLRQEKFTFRNDSLNI